MWELDSAISLKKNSCLSSLRIGSRGSEYMAWMSKRHERLYMASALWRAPKTETLELAHHETSASQPLHRKPAFRKYVGEKGKLETSMQQASKFDNSSGQGPLFYSRLFGLQKHTKERHRSQATSPLKDTWTTSNVNEEPDGTGLKWT
jgi:hypothetical protein